MFKNDGVTTVVGLTITLLIVLLTIFKDQLFN